MRLRRRRNAIRTFGPIAVLLALAVAATLVARDAAAVRRSIEHGDLVFLEGQPVYERLWRLDTTMPYTSDLFAIEDDLLYRHALRKYAAEDRRQRGRFSFSGPGLRAETQAALSIAEKAELSPARRSRLANLQGVISYDETLSNPSTPRDWRRRRSSTSPARSRSTRRTRRRSTTSSTCCGWSTPTRTRLASGSSSRRTSRPAARPAAAASAEVRATDDLLPHPRRRPGRARRDPPADRLRSHRAPLGAGALAATSSRARRLVAADGGCAGRHRDPGGHRCGAAGVRGVGRQSGANRRAGVLRARHLAVDARVCGRRSADAVRPRGRRGAADA